MMIDGATENEFFESKLLIRIWEEPTTCDIVMPNKLVQVEHTLMIVFHQR